MTTTLFILLLSAIHLACGFVGYRMYCKWSAKRYGASSWDRKDRSWALLFFGVGGLCAIFVHCLGASIISPLDRKE